MSQDIVRITCKVHTSLFQALLEALKQAGVYNLHQLSGRMAVLTDPRGLAVLLKSSGLSSEPVEVLSFLVPVSQELEALRLVAASCRLMIPGRGTVYSERLRVLKQSPESQLNQQLALTPAEVPGLQVFSDMTAIGCIVQRSQSDEIVSMLLDIGVVPTVTYASGTGIRDRLGLLRITLPKEKDLIQVTVGPAEADVITEKMIAAGHLDRPGKGFVYQAPVSHGVINFKTSKRRIGHAASVDQIIAAIDQIQGDFSWRQGLTGLEQVSRRSYMSGVELSFYLKEGLSETLTQAVMALGVTGATVISPKLLNPAYPAENNILPAREIVRIMVPEHLTENLLQLSVELGLCEAGQESIILCSRVPRAFTYQKKARP